LYGKASRAAKAIRTRDGVNCFERIAQSSDVDIDDFQFVNVRIRLR
jgi:hypothetical protein